MPDMYPASDTLDGAVVCFINYRDGQTIDLKLSGGAERGNPVIAYSFHGHENQQWKLERVKDKNIWPVFMIRNVKFGTCIDLGQGGRGTHVKGWVGSDTTNKHQLWRLITADTQGHSYIIQNVGNNMVLDLTGGSKELRTPIQGWDISLDMSNKNQIWRMVRMD
jgi:hypothetical protein